MSLFQDIKNTLRTDRDSAGLPCMDIKMADFDEFRHLKNGHLRKIFKGSRRMSAFDIWAYYI
jgi:hypothetical protein